MLAETTVNIITDPAEGAAIAEKYGGYSVDGQLRRSGAQPGSFDLDLQEWLRNPNRAPGSRYSAVDSRSLQAGQMPDADIRRARTVIEPTFAPAQNASELIAQSYGVTTPQPGPSASNADLSKYRALLNPGETLVSVVSAGERALQSAPEIVRSAVAPVAPAVKRLAQNVQNATDTARKTEAASGGPSTGLIAALIGGFGVAAAGAAALAARRNDSKKRQPVRRAQPQRVVLPPPESSNILTPALIGIGVLAGVGLLVATLVRK